MILHVNCTNTSQPLTHSGSCTVLTSLAKILTDYYQNNAFIPFSGLKWQFFLSTRRHLDIFALELNKSVLMSHRIPFIPIFVYFWRFIVLLYLKIALWAFFGGLKRLFWVLVAYIFFTKFNNKGTEVL